MTAILGISAFYHDSAAAVVVDGEIIAAAQEERFTRVKHDAGFPVQAIAYCLSEAGLQPDELDYVGFYDKPFLKFERLLETYLAYAPRGFRSFMQAMPLWLGRKLHLRREIRRGLEEAGRVEKGGWSTEQRAGSSANRATAGLSSSAHVQPPDTERPRSSRSSHVASPIPPFSRSASVGRRSIPCCFTEHHESHAASAFYPSPFEEAAILTMDGVGEWATTSFGVGRGNRIELTHELRFPHSLGLLYSAFTYYCGFKVNSGEYKLMGLAPYGEPRYAELIKRELIDLKADGSFRMDMRYFNYCQGLTMTNDRFHRLFGGPPRTPETRIEDQRYMDVAASIQQVTDEIVQRIGQHVHRQTGMKHLCLAGGVALNCVANGVLLREGPFEDLWIQPAAGDAGGALGVALFIWHQLLAQPRRVRERDSQHGSLLGPKFHDASIACFLNDVGANSRVFDEDNSLCEYVAELLADGKVVGWFQGRMEFGPRALGSRSILGDARAAGMQSTMNTKVKFRESFRPFAPSVLEERAAEYFELRPHQQSPYMLLVAHVHKARRVLEQADHRQYRGIDRLRLCRSEIPAVTHVDYSARIQTVDAQRHGRYYELLRSFERKTGCPVLINTSFNVRGEPIVCTPEQAYQCFLHTNMDALVLERHVLLKEEQSKRQTVQRDEYVRAFRAD